MSYLVQATGRRKRAVARVRLHAGTGEVTINGNLVATGSITPDYVFDPNFELESIEADDGCGPGTLCFAGDCLEGLCWVDDECDEGRLCIRNRCRSSSSGGDCDFFAAPALHRLVDAMLAQERA